MIGSRIRQLRKEKRVTQKELASIIGCSRVSVNNYETGKRTPDIEVAERIANYFGVSMDFLVGGTEIRYQGDMQVMLKDAEELLSILEQLPPQEASGMMVYLISTLKKSKDIGMEIPVLQSLDTFLVQLSNLLIEYEEVRNSIILSKSALQDHSILEEEAQLFLKEKTAATYSEAFKAINT